MSGRVRRRCGGRCDGGIGEGASVVIKLNEIEFTGRDDGRDQIAVGKSFDRCLSGIERRTVDVIAGAANIVSAHVRSRSESVTGRRVRAHVSSVTGITATQ